MGERASKNDPDRAKTRLVIGAMTFGREFRADCSRYSDLGLNRGPDGPHGVSGGHFRADFAVYSTAQALAAAIRAGTPTRVIARRML